MLSSPLAPSSSTLALITRDDSLDRTLVVVAEPEGQTVHLAVDWSVQALFLPVPAEAPLVVLLEKYKILDKEMAASEVQVQLLRI